MVHRGFFRNLTVLLILPCMLLGLTLQPAHAAMISTPELLDRADAETARARVEAFLQRRDVQQVMVGQGVDVREAEERLNAMSHAEIQAMARHIESLPAGGDGVGAVIGAALFIFLVLLITDILGLTHVFPFVNR